MATAARPWLIASGVLVVLIVVSLPVALFRGTPPSQWFRDAATYGLLAVAPIVALDAAASLRAGLLLGITTVAAALGALSYALYWVTARNLAIVSVEHIVLPTSSLPMALFVVALAGATLDPRRRVPWILVGGLAFGAFLVTGTRSALFFLVAVPIVAAFAGGRFARASAVVSSAIPGLAFAVVLLVQGAFSAAGRDFAPPIDAATPPPVTASPRPNETGTPATGLPATPQPSVRPPPNPDANLFERLGEFLTSPQRDGSIRERVTQYDVAWRLFTSSPLLGVGLGHPFEWTRIDGTVRRDFTADTPLVVPAKLGIGGVVWLVILARAWWIFVRQQRRARGPTLAGLALAGWGAILIALLWSGAAVEDKGFSFALMLLLALAFVELEEPEGGAGTSEDSSLGDDRELIAYPAHEQVRRPPRPHRGPEQTDMAQHRGQPAWVMPVVHGVSTRTEDAKAAALEVPAYR